MKPYHYFLAGLMLLTGTINTIVTKYADISCAFGVDYYTHDQSRSDNTCSGRFEGEHQFDHPFVQALCMFIGEFLCIIAFRIMVWRGKVELDKEAQNFSPIIFLIPALCDCAATSTMYFGLTLTYASQFQMLRGSVVIFTGLLSWLWLGNKPLTRHWVGMFFVLCGLVCVGLAAFLRGGSGSSAPNPVLGDILIVAAQVIVALQMVVEEKILGKYNLPPLQVVGWEGIFGMCIMSLLCIVFFFLPGTRAGGKFEDVNDAMLQFSNSWVIVLALCGMICSIAFFNYSGISVTKEMSATTRMVLDSVRTLTIWIYGMLVGWETFYYLQVIGFLLLLTGTFVYNDIIVAPLLRRFGCLPKSLQDSQMRPLLEDK